MSKKNYWFMRLGYRGEDFYKDLAINDSVAAIGYGTDRDLRNEKDYDDVRAYIHSVGRSSSDIVPINNFLNVMQVDDLVLLQIRPRGGHRNYIYGIARIASNYEPLKYLVNKNWSPTEEWRPARRIEWLARDKSMLDFRDGLLDYSYGKRRETLFPIGELDPRCDGLIERINKLIP